MIGLGGLASVYVAYWKNTKTVFAIKRFNNGPTKEIVNEVWCSFV
jgi:hypothetical protein